MRPVVDPAALSPGATLYHSAFGFARVDDVGRDAVALAWERPGGHLPGSVSFANLKRVYAYCAADGFFHRALHDHDALRRALLEQPSEALLWLLDDLGGPQRLRDVMDWLVGRELFTPKTFVRWWGSTEDAVRQDGRVVVEGEWIHAKATEGPRIVQLDAHAVAAEDEVDLGASLVDGEPGPADDVLRAGSLAVDEATSLLDAHPPASTLATVGLALAKALAAAHVKGKPVRPNAATAQLLPDGSVQLGPSAELTARWASTPSLENDVLAAAVALAEAFCGRSLPQVVDPVVVIPHLRHVVPDLPPSAVAPLLSAMRPDPAARPTAAEWVGEWERVQVAETLRHHHRMPKAVLRVGYDTHVGRAKVLATQTNQDALWVGSRNHQTLAVLADGISISDAGRGDQASWLSTQAIARVWQAAPMELAASRKLIVRALHLANRAVCEAALRAAGGNLAGRMPMGTTLLLASCEGNRIHLAWLGDSRAYVIGPWGASLLTADDNVSGERFVAWCARKARTWSSDGHALVRYLGHFDDHQRSAPFASHHLTFDLLPGERLVLCSDGITDYIDAHEATLGDALTRYGGFGTVDDAARALVNAANRAGGGDNATAIVMELAAGSEPTTVD